MNLYDDTMIGPHDKFLEIDLLAPGILNAYAGSSAATLISTFWENRIDIENELSEVTHRDCFKLTKDELIFQAEKLCKILDIIDKYKGWGGGGTRASKVMHRMRPNIMPIWDIIVGRFYEGAEQEWTDYMLKVFEDIRKNIDSLSDIRNAVRKEKGYN